MSWHSPRGARELVPAGPEPSRRVDPVAGVGRLVRSRLGRAADVEAERTLGRLIIATLLVATISPLLCSVVAVAGSGWSIARRRRAAEIRSAMLMSGLAEVTELYAVALMSGHNVATATEQVVRWTSGPVGDALVWCLGQSSLGRPLSDAFDDVPPLLGPMARPLVVALVSHERHGVPIVDALGALAAQTRTDRRRRAEISARRLPVALLFPLVLCVFPAFLLLTVVPVFLRAVLSFGF